MLGSTLYIVHKSKLLGYNPKIILSGRELNDSMSTFVADQALIKLQRNKDEISNSNILVLGLTFKENCPDIRNTKVADLVNHLENKSLNVDVYDPWANKSEVEDEFSIKLIDDLNHKKYDLIILAVSHDDFKLINFDEILKKNSVIYDLKGFLKHDSVERL